MIHDLIDETAERLKITEPTALLEPLLEAMREAPGISRALKQSELRQAALDAMASHARRQTRIDRLNRLQQLFVAALVGPAGGNATKATLMVAYCPNNYASARTVAWRLLTKAEVNEAILQAHAHRRASSDWACNRILELASSSIDNFVTTDEHGMLQIDLLKAQ